jgi:hypothetical protein
MLQDATNCAPVNTEGILSEKAVDGFGSGFVVMPGNFSRTTS